jgi:glycosyltransferase involved in cell wall biosynthesis
LLKRVNATIGPNDEVIFVDDFSSDSTFEEAIRSIPNDGKFRIIRHLENKGAGAARTTGLQAARGRYVWFPDWDDDWASDILDQMVTVAETFQHDMVIVGATRKWPDRETNIEQLDSGRNYNGCKLTLDLISGRRDGFLWNKLFLRERISSERFPEVRTQEDLAFLLQNSSRFASIGTITESLYSYVQREQSLTTSTLLNFDGLIECKKILIANRHSRSDVRLFEINSLLTTAISRASLADYTGFSKAIGKLGLKMSDIRVAGKLSWKRRLQLLLAITLKERYVPLHLKLT